MATRKGIIRDAGSETDFRSYYVFVAVLNVFYHLLSGNYLTIRSTRNAIRDRELAGRKKDKRAFLLSEDGSHREGRQARLRAGKAPVPVRAGRDVRELPGSRRSLRPAPGDPTPALEHIAFLFDGDWVVIELRAALSGVPGPAA